MKITFRSLFAFLLLHLSLIGQTQTLTFNAADAINSCDNQPIEVAVTVNHFTEIVGFQYTIEWNSLAFELVEIKDYNEEIGLSSRDFNPNTEGKLIVVWLEERLERKSLAENALLFTMVFNSLTINANSTICFTDDPTIKEAYKYENNDFFAFAPFCNDGSIQTTTPPILYVKSDATGAGDGSSWTDAFVYLQDALAAADNCTEAIWVAKGTYYPDEGAGQTDNDRNASFTMKNNLAIYGGFAGNEAADFDLDLRDFGANETILSGDIDQDDEADFVNNEGNSYHVIFNEQNEILNSTAQLNGVTISQGNANGIFPNDLGAGIYNLRSHVTLTNCHFINNFGERDGGGIYNDYSSPIILDCTFSNNAAKDGAAMYNRISSPSVSKCLFQNNLATEDGGGMFNFHSSPIISNSFFLNNSSISNGGSMYNLDNSSPKLSNCSFLDNSAQGNGGGMYNSSSSSPELINCSLVNNSANYHAGGILNQSLSIPILINSIIWGNQDISGIGTARASITNRTPSSTFTANYCIIQGYDNGSDNNNDNDIPSGNNNLNGIATNNESYVITNEGSLLPCSPVINAGDNNANNQTTDLAGNPRIINNNIDLGAYEFQGDNSAPMIANVAPTLTVDNDEGNCFANIEITHPAVTDNFSVTDCPTIFTYELAGATTKTATAITTFDGTATENITFNIGTTTLTYRAQDVAGNDATPQTVEITLNATSTLSATATPLEIVETDAMTNTQITVTRTNAACAASVQVSTMDGTATAANDYQTFSQQLNFAAGEANKTFNLQINGDTEAENTEQFTLVFSDPTNLILETTTLVLTILDDDSPFTHLDFDGIDDQIQVENLTIPRGFTLEMWLNYAGSQQSEEIIFSHANDALSLGFVDGHLQVLGTQLRMSSLFPTNVWKHVALTINNSGRFGSLYVDGALVSSEFPLAPAFATQTGTALIGAGLELPGIRGGMDEVRLWNEVRDYSDLVDNMDCELTGSEENLELYFDFNQAIPNGNNTDRTSIMDGSGQHTGELLFFDLIGTQSNFLKSDIPLTGACGATALAVQQLDFTAKLLANQTVELRWITTSTSPVQHFIVERAADGNSFLPLAQVNSSQQLFLDTAPLTGDNFYRIKAVTTAGEIFISTIQQVQIRPQTTLQLSPNPTTDWVNISTDQPVESIEVYDVLGRLVQHISSPVELRVDLSSQGAGVYWFKIRIEHEEVIKCIVKK